MSEIVVDSSVVAKWILAEQDSAEAQKLVDDSLAGGPRLVVLDLVFPEVANGIWKRFRHHEITEAQAQKFLQTLTTLPVEIEKAIDVLSAGA